MGNLTGSELHTIVRWQFIRSITISRFWEHGCAHHAALSKITRGSFHYLPLWLIIRYCLDDRL